MSDQISIHLKNHNTMKNNNLVAKYNKSEILKFAWVLFRTVNNTKSFGDCLRQSWHIAKNGNNNNTYNEIYKNFNKPILNYIYNKVKNIEDAQDICQEVFIRLHKHLANYDVYKAKISTWLYTIANNLIIDHYRTDKSGNYTNVSSFVDAETGKETYQFVADESYETEVVMDNADKSLKIAKAFASLKPSYKRIAELYFLEDKPYNEIAEICNVPMGTVKGMINRCRAMLQGELKDIRTMHKA
jgi:RNA polymerase sigma-70 factor, ECF subfamily